jgi:5-methylcytosine-specific restriction endonuclease McrA
MEIHKRKPFRRSNITAEENYNKYLPALREDFNCTCGYCGKTEAVTKRGFEIDHFVPQRLAFDRENDYSNLVYACFNCNRKKSGKFPTEDKNIAHNEERGIIDPTTADFNINLERNSDGDIIGLTNLGTYICEKIFKFNNRPMRQVWKAMEIIEKKTILSNLIKSKKIDLKYAQEYIEADEMLTNLLCFFFEKAE